VSDCPSAGSAAIEAGSSATHRLKAEPEFRYNRPMILQERSAR
jgi:hypothetical protein